MLLLLLLLLAVAACAGDQRERHITQRTALQRAHRSIEREPLAALGHIADRFLKRTVCAQRSWQVMWTRTWQAAQPMIFSERGDQLEKSTPPPPLGPSHLRVQEPRGIWRTHRRRLHPWNPFFCVCVREWSRNTTLCQRFWYEFLGYE
jgi:hypothetical protein